MQFLVSKRLVVVISVQNGLWCCYDVSWSPQYGTFGWKEAIALVKKLCVQL